MKRAATEVTLTEEAFPSDSFRILKGKTMATLGEIQAGANATYTIVARARVHGEISFPAATIEYMDGYKQRVSRMNRNAVG